MKKNGGVRPCVDYRKVNELVKPDEFPLPRIQDCLDAVTGSKLFSTSGLTSGYFHIPLKEADIPKSAFVCKYGHFEMTRMPLNNAASTFQRTMELALQGLQWITCLIYIDDIIVFGRNLDEHLSRIEEVFERLKIAGLKLKAEKCNMLQTKVVFLGHVVTPDGIKPNPEISLKFLTGLNQRQRSRSSNSLQWIPITDVMSRILQQLSDPWWNSPKRVKSSPGVSSVKKLSNN